MSKSLQLLVTITHEVYSSNDASQNSSDSSIFSKKTNLTEKSNIKVSKNFKVFIPNITSIINKGLIAFNSLTTRIYNYLEEEKYYQHANMLLRNKIFTPEQKTECINSLLKANSYNHHKDV